MAKDLKALRTRLVASPAARARFLANTLDLLDKGGLDVDDPDVLKSLDLNLDLSDGNKFVEGLAASTNIITIVL